MILDLGLLDYEEAYKVQKELVVSRRLGEIGDSMILAEHTPVFTIGRGGKRHNLLAEEGVLRDLNIKVLNVDRGGAITFHGPGQLVAYPIIDLRDRSKDLHKYLRDLEGLIINFLSYFSVRGGRMSGLTGVWVDSRKIGFIGIGASNWITYHGLSINIDVDEKYFSMMHPCGIEGLEVINLNDITKNRVSMGEAKSVLTNSFSLIFGAKSDCLKERAAAAR